MTSPKNLAFRVTEFSVSGKLGNYHYRELKIRFITLIVAYDTKFSDFGQLCTAAYTGQNCPIFSVTPKSHGTIFLVILILCSDQLFIMRLDIRYKDILIPYNYILIRLADCLSINLFGIYLWYPYTWPISLAYKYILIRNKYILVPYILTHDK